MVFKHHDYKQSGVVSMSAFKEALKSADCHLNSTESFQLLKLLDKDVTGMINYNTFRNEILKPWMPKTEKQ